MEELVCNSLFFRLMGGVRGRVRVLLPLFPSLSDVA